MILITSTGIICNDILLRFELLSAIIIFVVMMTKNKSILLTGPLQELIPNNIQTRNHLRVKSFSWPEQIIATAIQKGL